MTTARLARTLVGGPRETTRTATHPGCVLARCVRKSNRVDPIVANCIKLEGNNIGIDANIHGAHD